MTEIFLYGTFGLDFTAKEVAEKLAEADGDVDLHVASVGGSGSDATAIFAQIKQFNKGKVTARVDGFCFSAASYVICAADTVIAARDSEFMIHEASGGGWGTAEELKTAADSIEQLNQIMTKAYAAKTGQSEATIKADMSATTFMNAQEAMEYGLVDKIDDYSESTQAKMPHDFAMKIRDGKIDNVPDRIMAVAMSVTAKKAATPAKPPPARKEKAMEAMVEAKNGGNQAATTMQAAPIVERPNNEAINEAVMAERTRVSMITSAGQRMQIEAKTVDEYIQKNIPAATAQAEMIAMWAENDPAKAIDPVGANVQMVADGVDKMRAGITEGILARIGHPDGKRNEFTSKSLRMIATDYSAHFDRSQPRGMSATEEFHYVMGLTTSDLPGLLGGVVNRSLETAYKEASESHELWTGTGSYSDFRASKIFNVGLFPDLKPISERGEFEHGAISEGEREQKVSRQGRAIDFTAEMYINDDLNAFGSIPTAMARASKRTIANYVYQHLTGNTVLNDGKALFHNDHGNLLSGVNSALSPDALSQATMKMRKQSDRDAISKAGLNISPKYLIVPAALEAYAKELVRSSSKIGQDNPGIVNIHGGLTIVVDARLDVASQTAWYLACDYSDMGTIEVGFLNGRASPTVERNDHWTRQKVEFVVYHDFGVAPVDYRGMVKGTGA